MVTSRQAAYLHALGVDVYVPRSTPAWPLEATLETAAPSPVACPEPAARAPTTSAGKPPPVVAARAPVASQLPDIAANLDWE